MGFVAIKTSLVLVLMCYSNHELNICYDSNGMGSKFQQDIKKFWNKVGTGICGITFLLAFTDPSYTIQT